MYPKIEINIKGIKENISTLTNECNKHNVFISVVTKVLANNKEIVSKICNNVKAIADSRVDNIKNYQDINAEKWLIRLPMECEIEDVIKYCDVSLNSEIYTIKLLNEEAKKQNKKHKIILMYEIGDLREGLYFDKLKETILECKNLSNIIIYGLGCNLGCYGGIVPSDDNMNDLVDAANRLEKECDIKFEVISGGNSTSYKMLKEGKLPQKVNNLRIGESIYLGTLPTYDEIIDELNHDNFIMSAQIVEVQVKDSLPKGEMMKNSFGETVHFEDKGKMKRALINIGKQDTGLDLKPLDKDIDILGGSSDYILLDVTNCEKDYKVGDVVSFIPDYASLLKMMTSEYVRKEIKDE